MLSFNGGCGSSMRLLYQMRQAAQCLNANKSFSSLLSNSNSNARTNKGERVVPPNKLPLFAIQRKYVQANAAASSSSSSSSNISQR
jgi:hypothetical protein